MAEIKVSGVKTSFSNNVTANKLPKVFNENMTTNNHKIISIILLDTLTFRYPPFIEITSIKKILIIIEMGSDRFISSTLFNLPPHTIL